MSAMQFKAKARKHWTRWLPSLVRELREVDELEAALQVAAISAQERLLELMAQGYRAHEAEEVALHEFILLRPEPGVE